MSELNGIGLAIVIVAVIIIILGCVYEYILIRRADQEARDELSLYNRDAGQDKQPGERS